MLTEHDIYLFRQGTHSRLYYQLGCHLGSAAEQPGAHFAVWAPNARRVSVMGDWSGWQPDAHALVARPDGSGVWEGFVPGAKHGDTYKYRIESSQAGYVADKADPFALCSEVPPATASRVWSLDYEWGDAEWMRQRAGANALGAPICGIL